MTAVRWLLFLLALCVLPQVGWAHKPSDALLQVQLTEVITARWEVALRDLEISPGHLDDGDGQLHLQELRGKEHELFETFAAHVRFAAGGRACTLHPSPPIQVTEHSDGAYAALSATVSCPAPGAFSLDYDYLFDADPQHRLIAHVGTETHILSRSERSLRIDVNAPAHSSQLFGSGLTHILEGTDHLLFLFALLLPAVLVQRKAGPAIAQATFRPVLGEVLRVVTAFTIAHSLTLSLAVLGLATLPARLVEPAIAASVVVAALANVRPAREHGWFGGARWPIAYTLGLLHGYGFSSALDDAGLAGTDVFVPLLTFNLGVEAGQLAVVALVLPLLFLVRRWRHYESVILRGASVSIALIACAWFVERAFDVKLLG